MRMINQVVMYIKHMSPYDYGRYINKLYDFDFPKYIRKIKACTYAVERYCALKLKKNNNRLCGTESQEFIRKNNSQYIEELMKYDVISFDMFDSLILRRILDSSDVFHLVGIKLRIKGFKNIRQCAEEEARRRLGLDNTYDAKLKDIYSVLQEWYGIDVDEGIAAELEVENALCVANPYWFQVFQELIRRGKIVVITTDMYISEQDIQSLLKSNGYVGQEKVYVSSEFGDSKRNGKIYDLIQKDFGSNKRYIHIGDHEIFDYKMAKQKGWDAIYYQNVHVVGSKYRTWDKDSIADSVFGGIINVALHNGVRKYGPLEEFGFNYYGRVHVGYCQWLQQLAFEKEIDKFLFISQDGDLLKKIYSNFFDGIPSDYVYVSEYALNQINSLENMEVFIKQNIEEKAANGKFTLRFVLEELGMKEVGAKLSREGLAETDILNKKNLESVIDFLYKNRAQIAEIYKESYLAAQQYFGEVIKGCKRICVVSVGELESCLHELSVFLNKHMKWQGKILGAWLGIERGRRSAKIYSQEVYTYTDSSNCHSGLYRNNDLCINNIVNKIVFSPLRSQLLRYKMDRGNRVIFVFSNEPCNNIEMATKIQKGVLEYVEEYCDLENKLGVKLIIEAESACKPAMNICKKHSYVDSLFGVLRCGDMNCRTQRED